MKTGDPRHGAPPESAEHDEIDELFEGANPEPPPNHQHLTDAVLLELLQKKRPMEDPAWDDVEKCSRCYSRLKQLRGAAGTTRRRFSRWWVAAIAAGVLLTLSVVGALWWRGLNGQRTPPDQGAGTRLVAELDLRPYGASRGENGEGVQPLLLRRGIVDLMMILPTGAEPGRYDIQLVDAELKSRITATADGVLRDYRTELRTTLDLGGIPPGRYQLALRYGTQRWRLYPVEIR
jgi:hypothetical protein